jgi:hypothetical protein
MGVLGGVHMFAEEKCWSMGSAGYRACAESGSGELL